LAQRSGIQSSTEEWVVSQEFKIAVLADMQQRLASNGGGASLKAFERVRDVHISLEPFTADNGLLTPSLKLKRFIAKKRYQKELDSLYSAASAAETLCPRRTSNEMRDRRPSNPGKPPPPPPRP
jgi:long-chain acyl-CoA synthetase